MPKSRETIETLKPSIPKVCLQRAFKMLLRRVLRCVWHSSGCLMLNSCNQAWPPRSPRHRDAGIGRGRPQDHLAKLGSWVDGKGSRVPHPQLKSTLDQDKSSNKPSHWPTPINGVGMKRFRENLHMLVYSFHTVWRWLGMASKCQSGNVGNSPKLLMAVPTPRSFARRWRPNPGLRGLLGQSLPGGGWFRQDEGCD